MTNPFGKLLDRSRPSNEDAPLSLVEMDDETAVDILAVLGSETTYLVYKQLHEEPQLPRELAEQTNSSIQNVHYHLDKLEEADLIEPVETWYSDNGVEMKLYAPVHNPLVISFGSSANREQIRTTLSRVFGLIGCVSVLSLVGQVLNEWRRIKENSTPDNVAGSGSKRISEPDALSEEPLIEALLSAPELKLFLLGVAAVSIYAAYRLTRGTR